jgi:phenylacetate-CoA ligase
MNTSAAGMLSYLTRSAYFSLKGYAVNRVKLGRKFFAVLDELERSQWLSDDGFRDLQNGKLREVVQHAYTNVPYYRRLFDSLHLRPSDIRTVDDLTKIPVLSKEDLRANHADLIDRTSNRRLLASGWTTGSTGTPINALRTMDSIIFENATIWRQRRWAGTDVYDRKAAVWGAIWDDVIVPSASKHVPPYWRYNAADRQMLFSYYHMTDRTLGLYIDALEKFKPTFIEGFPSTLLILAQHLKQTNRILPLRSVFTSSEPLYAIHREEIERRFATKIFDHYGQAERVAYATECEHHRGLHVNPEYGIVEVLKNGEPAAPGETGEIVGTGLNNSAMPLLRYKTGDLASRGDQPCACGRKMPLLQAVEGRLADSIITKDGIMIPGNGIMGAFHGIENIRSSQVVQEDPENVIVRIVKEDRARDVNLAYLRRNLESCLGRRIRLEFQMVESLDLDGLTKHPWVVSKVSRETLK